MNLSNQHFPLFRLLGLASLIMILVAAFRPKLPVGTDWMERPVAEILQELGEESSPHMPRQEVEGVSVEAGRKLVYEGIAIAPKGKSASRQSKHFVCTSCHNMEKEDPDLAVSDPEARLDYAIKNKIPFLPGTTLYGVVNRETYYNGDYEKKYGDLVKPARKDLRGAIHLCATECAQGRPLKDWEMESILAYLWTIDLKMDDLILNEDEEKVISQALNAKGDPSAAASLIKSKYLSGSPATFLYPPPDRKAGYDGVEGRADVGEQVFQASCLHCHGEQRYSFFFLDKDEYSRQFMTKHMAKYTRYSLYQVSRYGTSPIAGKKAYMPHYTAERMSNQQIEDLRAYLAE